jgi:hypothetical protein
VARDAVENLQSSSSSERQKKPVSHAFIYLNSQDMRREYPKRLKKFFDYLGLPADDGGDDDLDKQGQAFLDKAVKEKDHDQHWLEDSIMDFLEVQKKRVDKKELAPGTLKNFYQPIKQFCDMSDLTTTAHINWKRISRALPRAQNYSSSDRAPTVDEIRKLVGYPDRRIKPIVYVMCSSGIRLGAWDYLQWKHVTPIKKKNNNDKGGNDDEVIAAKLIIYAGTPEPYYTFITPEAYNALKDWMDFRASYGEEISDKSWLMRDKWRTADIKIGRGGGEKECPSCGSMLAESLTRRVIRPEVKIFPPKIQTADNLLLKKKKLRFDIPKIDSFIILAATDLCCISGYSANMLLTRLCVRSLLPDRYGGLDSPYVIVADTGNHTDVYGSVNIARQYGMSKESVAERILVIRAFTVHQVKRLLLVELPNIIQNYQVRCVIVPGLLNAFDEDPNMKMKDVKKEITKIMKAINELSTKVVVLTSIQVSRLSEPVLCTFKKRIKLVQEGEKYGTLKAELYNQRHSKIIKLTEREMKIIPKK